MSFNPRLRTPNSQLRTRYRMPAEWEPHQATWLTWPTNAVTWPGKMLKEVEDIYLQMMRALLPGEKVNLLVPDAKTGRKVSSHLKKADSKNLILHQVKTVDVWIRDYGPIFVRRQRTGGSGQETGDRGQKTNEVGFCKFKFNAWGNKYSDLARDNGVVDRLDALRSFKRFDIPVILEGGSIDVNGLGTCLTTEQCLLDPNRNPGLTKKEIEANLRKNLGVTKIIWLKEGIEGDDTDGHVDDITRFAGPRTVLTAVEPDTSDRNHSCLEENKGLLRRATDQDGKKFLVIELPMPGRLLDGARDRLPASYANFYVGNHAVLVPVYGHRNDKTAVQILREVFKKRKVVPIECAALVHGLGSIHCVTQQQPA